MQPDQVSDRGLLQKGDLFLAFSVVFMLVNTIALSVLRPDDLARHSAVLLLWLACVVMGRRLLHERLPGHDPMLFPVIMFMSGWGLLLINRLAPTFADRQVLWLVLALAAMLFVALTPMPLRWLRRYRYIWLVGGIVLLTSTIVLGTNPSGQLNAPQLWLGLAGVYFQPSEALKIVLVAFLASYLAEQYPILRAGRVMGTQRSVLLTPRMLGPMLLMWGLSIAVLIWQRDLGTAMLFFVVFVVLVYIASGNIWVLVGGAGMVLIAAGIGYRWFDVVALRIDVWLNPWPEADGDAYQIVQSLQAVASGGIWGDGLGQGSPGFIPVVHSDFVFAALAEEYGLLGVVVLLACVGMLIARSMRVAVVQQAQPFYALLAVGIATVIGVQNVLIMGGVTRLLPLTGVTLPFLSYGGSSLLVSFVMVGLLLRLSVQRPDRPRLDAATDDERTVMMFDEG